MSLFNSGFGYGFGGYGYGGYGGYGGNKRVCQPIPTSTGFSFTLLVVMFVLLVIVGTSFPIAEECPPGTVPVDGV